MRTTINQVVEIPDMNFNEMTNKYKTMPRGAEKNMSFCEKMLTWLHADWHERVALKNAVDQLISNARLKGGGIKNKAKRLPWLHDRILMA
jgi:hypothetical protein